MTIRGKQLAVALALVLACAVPTARAQGNIDFAKLEIQTVKITDGLYVWMVLHHDDTCPQLRELT